jgi:hypothetical protein
MPDIVRINGTVLSWNSTLHKLDNEPYEGIVEFNLEQKRERKVVYAAKQNGTPLGDTAGKYSVSAASMKMLRDTAFAFKQHLAQQSANQRSYGDIPFTYLLQIDEPTADGVPLKVLVTNCKIVGEKEAHAEGTDELVTEFELGGAMIATVNDLTLWSAVGGIV